MDNCPTRLYRYRSLGAGAAKYVEQTISCNELFFSRPVLFNDPFDCLPTFEFEASDVEIASYHDHLIKKYKPELNREQRRLEKKSMLKDKERNPRYPDAVMRIQQQHTEQIKERIGVLCLSGVNDDILMWSHYADSHRGICLEFDGCFEFFANAQEVKYCRIRPRINPFRQTQEEMMEAALLTKSENWAYEQEWRLIHYAKGPGVYQFPPEALTGVIFGAQISSQDVKKLLGWIDARTHPLKLYRSSISDMSFSLKIEEVSLASLRT